MHPTESVKHSPHLLGQAGSANAQFRPQTATRTTVDQALDEICKSAIELREMARALSEKIDGGPHVAPHAEDSEPLGMHVVDRLRALNGTLSAAHLALNSALTALG